MNKNNRRKKIAIFLTAFIAVIAIIHIGVFIFLNVSGKSILKNYVKKQFNAEAELDSVSFAFPFTVVVKNFRCNDVTFAKADVSLGLFNPFSSHIDLGKVYVKNLNVKLKIEKDKISIDPIFVRKTVKEESLSAPAEANAVVVQKNKQKDFSIAIGKLLINNASLQISDLTKDVPATFVLKNIDVRLKHFVYPRFSKFYVDLSASLKKQDVETDNIVTLRGWVDYARKNMDLKLNINNADYILFSEYYPPFWKPDNLGIKEARLSLNSNMSSVNNDLVIEAILSLDKIEFLENLQDESKANSLKTMIALFKGDNDKPSLPIKLRTKMDSFHVDFSSLQSEFKGKMKLDIGTIVISILDKARNKIKDTTIEVKEATVDKAVDKVKDAAGAVKGVTVDKAVGTIKDVVGTIKEVVNPAEEKPSASSEQSTVNEIQSKEVIEPQAPLAGNMTVEQPAKVNEMQPQGNTSVPNIEEQKLQAKQISGSNVGGNLQNVPVSPASSNSENNKAQ